MKKLYTLLKEITTMKKKITFMIIIVFQIQFGFAQWQLRSSGVSTPLRGIYGMSAADSATCYGVLYDANNYLGDPLHDITITHDGGATWHSQTIPGLENNILDGVSAITSGAVHVIGWNYVSGGGNVFHSTDSGMTWQREAANAFTDAASFPDNIKFFDPQNGVIFGDPANGYFEIYTTSNGGDSWSRVPSINIPASLPNEEGLDFVADAYLNTIWVITVTTNINSNFVSARLLQSDDKGISWYVRNSSLTIGGSDGDIKFRNASVGLYKNNGILYRTTNGGTTWNVVNYSGTWFSYDFHNVPGKDGWWISTGGDANFTTNSAKGFGSSISHDDGDHWVTLDTAVDHTCVFMTSPTHGYSGGITTGSGNDGVFVYLPDVVMTVTLFDFSGEAQSKQNLLHWATASEQNNTGFEVQRSSDSYGFTKIGFVTTQAINGSSNVKLNYDFIDKNYSESANYYRLKQIDKDGKFSYSNIVVLKDKNAIEPGLITMYPNPAKNMLNIQIASSGNNKIMLLVTDLAGRCVMNKVTNVGNGESIVQLNVSSFAAGTYFLKVVSAGGEIVVKKFIKR